MKEEEIKKWIRNSYNLHGNQKVYLTDNFSFWIRIGDCDSMEIPFPTSLVRELQLESIGI